MYPARILVVEDDPVVSFQIRERLKAMGYGLAGIIASGEEALDVVREQHPDLVLMDIQLQGAMDGIAAAREIRHHFHLPVIFLSGHSDDATLERARVAEPYGFLIKPFDGKELRFAIEIALYKHRTDEEIRRLNRLYDVLSQVNQAVVRASSWEELFIAVCRLLVDRGGIELAWIGRLDQESFRVVPVARFGTGGEIFDNPDCCDGIGPNLGELSRALLQGSHFICAQCRDQDGRQASLCTAGAFGFQRCGWFPFRFQGEVWGGLGLGVAEAGFFQAREVELLDEVALDISFALDKLESDARREHSEAALRSSEAKFRSYIENAPMGVLVADPRGRFVEVNSAAAEMLGTTMEELANLSFREILASVGLDSSVVDFQRIAMGGREGREVHLRRKDGTTIWASIHAVALEDNRFLAFCRDITVRRQAEAALKEEVARRRTMMEQSRDGIVIVDEHGRVFEANRAFTEMLGYTAREIRDLYVWDWDAHRSRSEIEKAIRSLDQTGDQYVTRHRRKDGSQYDVEITRSVAIWEGRKLILCVCRDISERLKAEAALRESERRYRMVADYNYDWEYWVGPDGRMIYVSPSCERITGYTAEEFTRDPDLILSITHPEDRDPIRSHWVEMSSQESEVCQADYRIVTRGGEIRWISHYCRLVSGENGICLGRRASNRDITDRVRATEETARIEAQLRHAQKMEAIGTLAGGIAHDFNNILSPIIGYTEMVLDDLPESSPSRLDLEQVLTAAHRAKDLVQQMLSFSRLGEQQTLRPVDASAIVREALKLLRASLPSSIDIRLDDHNVMILADSTQIHQVVVNLCTNAAHAMEDQGTLGVSLTKVNLSPQEIATLSAGTVSPGTYLKLSVSDTGKGMSDDTLSRIFEPYFTTKEVNKGTGLGLAVVHGIVKRHRGMIQVQSELGKGSVFNVYLPVAEAEENQETAPAQAIPTGSERILLVDDEPAVADLCLRMLEQLGYTVTAMTHPKDALDLFRSDPARFDLVITDYTMPHMVGTDLAAAIRSVRPDMPIIVCTGFSHRVSEKALREVGIKGFATKPFTKKGLAHIIRNVLDG